MGSSCLFIPFFHFLRRILARFFCLDSSLAFNSSPFPLSLNEPMKHQIVLLFSVLLLSSLLASARLLVLPKQGEKEAKASDNALAGSSAELKDDMELMELMGLEECNEKDEECSSRRMLGEAHLDYIYTQHHKP